VLKASPGAAIFGQDVLFDIPLIADWQKIGEHRQQLTDLNNPRQNEGRIDYGYKAGQKLRRSPDGIRSLGSLRQSIQMEQSRFNVETK
jgi:hypothetical protein